MPYEMHCSASGTIARIVSRSLIKGILYADSKGSQTGLLGTTIQLTFTGKSPAGWYHLTFPTPLKLAHGSYWIGMITGASQYVGAEHFKNCCRNSGRF
jgi:hypothetical protein